MGKNAQIRRARKAETYTPGIHSTFTPLVVDRRLPAKSQADLNPVRLNPASPRVVRGRRYPLMWAWGYLKGVPEDQVQKVVEIAIDQGFPPTTVSVLELKNVLKVAGATGYIPLQIQNIRHRGVRQFLAGQAARLG